MSDINPNERQLGAYTLVHKIAEGGMASIFLAEKAGPGGFGKQLVIKRILPHLVDDQNFVDMFLDEARNAANFNNPNIVQIYDFGEADGHYFIAMEYIDGPDLAQVGERVAELGRQVPPGIVARIIADALGGLDYAHNFNDPKTGEPLNLVHRDISPHNLLLNKEGTVKLVDFGIAKAATSAAKTQTGAVKGKFSYMAPEQIASEDLDGRCDVFAMGIVLYELAIGKRPFGDVSEMMAINAILNQPPIPASTLGVNLPVELEQIIFKALEKDRNARFSNAAEMQMALQVFMQQSGQFVTTRDVARYLEELFKDNPDLSTFDGLITATVRTPGITGASGAVGGGGNKNLVIAIMVIMLLIIGGGGYLIFAMLSKKGDDDGEEKKPTPVANGAEDVSSGGLAAADVAGGGASSGGAPPSTSSSGGGGDEPDVKDPPPEDTSQASADTGSARKPAPDTSTTVVAVKDTSRAPSTKDTSPPPPVEDTTPPPVERVETFGEVELSCKYSSKVYHRTPGGATLLGTINLKGATFKLPTGVQELEIKSLDASVKALTTLKIPVREGRARKLQVTFRKGAVFIKTNPEEGVKVFVDGKKIGTSPINEHFELWEGPHLFKLEHKGKKKYHRDIEIKSKGEVPLNVLELDVY